MRILHLLKHGVKGNGHVHVAVDLACAQSAAGHEVTFAAARPDYADLMRGHGVHVVELSEPTSIRRVPRAALELARLCREVNPEIINAHMMSSAVLAYPVAKALRIPLVTTMHNSFDKHSALMRLGRVVIAVSDAERRLLLSRGYSADRVVTVYNGATESPRDVLPPDRRKLARPCVMTLSGLHPRKAVDDVIRAFADVSPSFPDWHLNVVGWGPSTELLEGMVSQYGLGRVVHFLGSSTAPRSLLEQADIFATATLADPCPLAIMEARAAGCAVVGTAVGGIPETLQRGDAGQIVPVRDPAAMAAAFRRLMGDPDELAVWRARAAQTTDFFTVSRMAADHIRLYESVVRRQPLYRPDGVPAA